MSEGEQLCYELGSRDAAWGLNSTPIGLSHQERLMYEQGYHNHAGETADA
jgi:hypothetical protein